MASRFVFSGQQFFTGPGKPLSGGKINFWSNGTTSNKNTWQEVGLSNLNTNPVILDADGRVPEIWANASDVFSIRILDSSDAVVVPTIDDLSFLSVTSVTAAAVLAALNGNPDPVVIDGDTMGGTAFVNFITALVLTAAGSIDASAGAINLGTVTGPTTFSGVVTHGANVISDTDSTDDLGTTSVRWLNLFVDKITVTNWRRARSTSAGALQANSQGIASVNKTGTGIYDYTLDNAVATLAEVVVLASAEVAGTECIAAMTNVTTCRVVTTIAGAATDVNHSLLIMEA